MATPTRLPNSKGQESLTSTFPPTPARRGVSRAGVWKLVQDPGTGMVVSVVGQDGVSRELSTSAPEPKPRTKRPPPITERKVQQVTTPSTEKVKPKRPAPEPPAEKVAERKRRMTMVPNADSGATPTLKSKVFTSQLESLLQRTSSQTDGDTENQSSVSTLEGSAKISGRGITTPLPVPVLRRPKSVSHDDSCSQDTGSSSSGSVTSKNRRSMYLFSRGSSDDKKRGQSLTDKEDGILSMMVSQLKFSNTKKAMGFIHYLNDDDSDYDTSHSDSGSEPATPVSKSFSSSSSSLAGDDLFHNDQPVQLQRRSRLRETLSLTDEKSPLYLAISESWMKEVFDLTDREKTNIQLHCAQLLNSSRFIPENDQAMCQLLKNYLCVYQTLFHSYFPRTCEVLINISVGSDDHGGASPTFRCPVWKEDVIEVLCEDDDFLCIDTGSVGAITTRTGLLLDDVEKVLSSEIVTPKDILNMRYIPATDKYIRLYKKVKEFKEALPGKEMDGEGARNNLVSCFRDDLEDLQSKIADYNKALKAFSENDFRNKKTWDYCIRVMAETVKSYLGKRYSGSELIDRVSILEKWREGKTYRYPGHPNRPHIYEDLTTCEQELMVLFKIEKKVFEQYREERLKTQPATLRSKILPFHFNDSFHQITIEQRPATFIYLGEARDGREYDLLSFDGHTYPSCQRDAPRAVNLMVTRVKLGDDVILKEVRTAVPYAYAVSKKAERNQITDQRWRDILTLCSVSYFPRRVLNNFCPEGELSKPAFAVPGFYMCLLSPDNLRPPFSTFEGVDNERNWCYEIDKKMEDLSSKPLQLNIRKRDGQKGHITIRPNLFLFVCPCNQLGYSSSLDFAKAWENADVYNHKAFLKLFGTTSPDEPIKPDSFVGTFLTEHQTLDPIVLKEIEEIAYLLRSMFTRRLHHTLGQEPFLFHNYLSELGRLLGVANISGCKSAKDRTGNYERSNIEMALRLSLSRRKLKESLGTMEPGEGAATEESSLQSMQVLPPIDRHLTDTDFFNNSLLLLCSNQLENTMDCTGKPGVKIPRYMLGQVHMLYPAVSGYHKSDKDKGRPKPQGSGSVDGAAAAVISSSKGAVTGFSLVKPGQPTMPPAGRSTWYLDDQKSD
ncbi:inositol phosphate phosphatase SopB [Parendozoicomonas haliclonae]|uniref:Inositol phosphate phosphatase SopB n=1 Tax=Parendozoicomonas haliclonae TaxID=1960125 RepID=A0A1X7ARX1_9GAMM|nr:inositol phosphate phosphatase SopB [Parendozoicomonas haliclonae]SMA50167.1 Inositol phosphate phosphatase SopB [Parendozoicomonas haliclonae]